MDIPEGPLVKADRWSSAVVGAAIEVHKVLGPGLLESVYENALCLEFEARQIPFLRQHAIRLYYKGQNIGDARVDLLVDGCLVVELKAVETLHEAHQGQVLGYLKAGGFPLGLLINFNVPRLRDGLKRLINT